MSMRFILTFLLMAGSLFQVSANDSLLLKQLNHYEARARATFGQADLLDSSFYYLDGMAKTSYELKSWDRYVLALCVQYQLYQSQLDFVNAGNRVQAAVDSADKYLEPGSFNRLMAYNNMGTFLSEQGEFEEALAAFEKSIEILNQIPDAPGIKKNRIILHNNVGTLAFDQGDLGLAENYFKRALRMAKDSLLEYSFNALLSTKRLGQCASKQGDFALAKSYFKEGEILLNKYEKTRLNQFIDIYHYQAFIYRDEENWTEVWRLTQLALGLQDKHRAQKGTGFNEDTSYRLLGEFYAEKGDLTQANQNFERAYAIAEKRYEHLHHHVRLGVIHRYWGEGLMKNQKWQAALDHYRQLMYQYSSLGDSLSIPSSDDWRIVDQDLLKGLHHRAQILGELYDQSQDRSQLKACLEACLEAYELTIATMDRARRSVKAESSRLFLSSQSISVFEEAMLRCLEMADKFDDIAYRDLAFRFSEQSRAASLLQSIQATNAQFEGGVPDSLLQKERSLSQQLAHWKAKLSEAGNKLEESDSVQVRLWQDKAFAIQEELSALTEAFEKDFPAYFQLKYQIQYLDRKTLQAALADDKTTFVSYFWGYENVIVQAVNQSGIHQYAIAQSQINTSMMRLLKHVYQNGSGTEQFLTDAYDLFKHLLESTVTTFAPQTERLILVTDGQLGFLPFETLLSSKVEKNMDEREARLYQRLPYLFQSQDIRYAYSASLFFQDPLFDQRKPGKLSDLLAFGPEYEKQLALGFSQKEAQTVAEITRGEALLGLAASRDAFLKQAENHSLLHIAAHGLANENQPMLAYLRFSAMADSSSDKLYSYEIYGQHIPAQLVVLSACESGSGQLAQGEGIMSLARAFRYAGTGSILMSLWQADDYASGELMRYFYEGLASGEKTTAAALQASRKQFLAEASMDRMHPYYWAGFRLMGQGGSFEKGFAWWLFAALLAIVGIGFAFVLRRKTRAS